MENILDTSSDENERMALTSMFSGKKSDMKIYTSNSSQKLLIYKHIEPLDYILGMQVDSNEYFKANTLVNNRFGDLIMFSLFIIILMMVYLYFRISRPIILLVNEISSMGEEYFNNSSVFLGDNEIITLKNAFRHLRSNLDAYIQNIHSKNEQLKTVFDSMPGVLSIRNKSFEILLMNNRGLSNGRREEDAYSKKCYEFFFNRLVPCVNCPVERTIREKEAFTGEIRENGEIFSVSSFPIFKENGDLKEMLVYSENITLKIIRDMELESSKKFAVIGQIAAGITHELKNNLSVINGAYFLLNEITHDPEIKSEELIEVLEDLNSGIRNSEEIIYSLFGFSDDSNNLFSKINIISIINQILILYKSYFIRNNIEVFTEFPDGDIYMYAQANSIKFSLINIINNAGEAMEKDPKALKIRAYTHFSRNREYVHIEIIDTGKGIDPSIKSRIFDPFYSTRKNGYGLGLWLAQENIRKHYGYIYVESKMEVGTTFTVVMPID